MNMTPSQTDKYIYHSTKGKEIFMEVIVTEHPDISKGQISPEERQRQLEARDKAREDEHEHSRYHEWAQLNLEQTVIDALDQLSKYPAAMRIFLFLVKNMDGYNAIMASHKVISEALDMSIPTVSRAIKYLSDNGILHIMKSGTSNVYVINNKVVWKSYGENMEYCKFPASVILAKSEQPEAKPAIRRKKVQTVSVREDT